MSTSCAGGERPAAPDVVRVAAAASLRYAFDDLAALFEADNPGARVVVTYGSSGTFYAQVTSGAPFDVFFSADLEYPRALEVAGLAELDSTVPYASGRLAVWVPTGSAINIDGDGLEALADTTAGVVAVANPEHAPYGRAAIAALDAAGVLDVVQPKLVLGETVSQAAQFVESGNADAGIIALSLALSPAMTGRGRYAVVPAELHPPLTQGAVVLSAASAADAARMLIETVMSPAGQVVLERHGFGPP